MPLQLRQAAHFVTLATDGTTTNANTAFSPALPGSFRLTAPNGKDLQVDQLIFFIRSVAALNGNGYGSLAQLPNGIRITRNRGSDGQVISDFTPDLITLSAHFLKYNADVNPFTFTVGNNVLASKFDFSADYGKEVILYGSENEDGKGDYMEIFLQDDFTGFIEHNFTYKGIFL